jgi:hypothetical protein
MGRPSRTRPSANAETEAWEARSSVRCSNLPSAGRREPTITEAPAVASSAARARPIPALPPVTTASRPRRDDGAAVDGRESSRPRTSAAITDLRSASSGAMSWGSATRAPEPKEPAREPHGKEGPEGHAEGGRGDGDEVEGRQPGERADPDEGPAGPACAAIQAPPCETRFEGGRGQAAAAQEEDRLPPPSGRPPSRPPGEARPPAKPRPAR